jgi:hypothetical protein
MEKFAESYCGEPAYRLTDEEVEVLIMFIKANNKQYFIKNDNKLYYCPRPNDCKADENLTEEKKDEIKVEIRNGESSKLISTSEETNVIKELEQTVTYLKKARDNLEEAYETREIDTNDYIKNLQIINTEICETLEKLAVERQEIPF